MTDIREGFLCPDCQAQFPTHMQLESHYEVAHLLDQAREASNRPASGNPLKDILGKARKILINEERPESDSTTRTDSDIATEDAITNQGDALDESHFYLMLREGQTIGIQNDLFDKDFKRIRDSRIERQVMETNKLLITLDKLLRGMPQGMGVTI